MSCRLPGQRGHPEWLPEKSETKWSNMVFCYFTKVSYSREWYAWVQGLTLEILSFCYRLLITLLYLSFPWNTQKEKLTVDYKNKMTTRQIHSVPSWCQHRVRYKKYPLEKVPDLRWIFNRWEKSTFLPKWKERKS